MSTFTSTGSSVRFTDTDGDVSFTATRPAVTFTAAYQSVTSSGGASDLDDLTDVTITSAAAGDGLRYNGTAWVDTPMSARWTATCSGAFGPGFDELVPADVFGDLAWGADYFLYQSPDGAYFTQQASNGDTIVKASYLLGAADSYTGDITQEGLWTLTGGVWVRNSAQPLPGEIVTVEPFVTGATWDDGLTFVKMSDGRMETPTLQYLRDVIATSTIIESFTADATLDATTSGAHAGLGLCNATSAAFTVTLVPAADDRGRSVLFVKTDSSGNAVSIDANASETINGSTSAVTLTTQWDWVRLTSDGTGWVATRGSSGGGTVDVVSNVAQDRILGRTSSGSGNSEELTAAQTRTLLGLSIEPTRRLPLAASYAGSFSGMYGAPPWDIYGNVTGVAYAAGAMRGLFCNIGGAPTLATICFEVSATSLTAGQSVTIACYALNSTTGMPTGTPVWTETQVVGTSTGVYQKATTNALPAAGCFLAILNPSTNAGSVTIYDYQPTGPYLAATRSVANRCGLVLASLSAAPDLTSYQLGSAAAASTYGYDQRGPLLLLR